MIESFAMKLAIRIKHNVPDHPVTLSVLKYSLAIVLNTLFIVIGTLSVSFFTGKTKEVLVLLVAFALLRQVSGGIHLKSGMACALTTTAAFTILSFFDASLMIVQLINIISLLLVILFAPSRIRQQNKIPIRYYPLLKFISAAIVATSFFVQSPTLSICFLVQSCTLITRREVTKI